MNWNLNLLREATGSTLFRILIYFAPYCVGYCLERVVNSRFSKGNWKTHLMVQVAEAQDLQEYHDLFK